MAWPWCISQGSLEEQNHIYDYKKGFIRLAYTIWGWMVPLQLSAHRELDKTVAAQSKKLEASEQERLVMWSCSKAEAWKLGESLVWICIESLRKMEFDVHGWWQSHLGRMEHSWAGWLPLSFTFVPFKSQGHIQGRTSLLSGYSTYKFSLETPSQTHPEYALVII
jgi:hypothetical protein